MIRSKIILFFIIVLTTMVYANPFSTYKDYLGASGAEKDSVEFYVDHPISNQSMDINDTTQVIVSNVFNLFPDYPEWYPSVDNPTIVYPEVYQNPTTLDLYIELISNTNIGKTDVIYTAYIDSSSIIYEASDTFTVIIDDPRYEWNEWGTSYSFLPEYCVGLGGSPWKAATHFSLIPEDSMHIYKLKQIEFGFAWEEMVDWKLVWFDEVPTDSLFGDMADSVLCTAAGPTYIEESYIDSNFTDTYLSGEVALVFSSEGNFMSLDPNGESSNTWIWDETSGWALASSYTSAYDGAWYMRLQVHHTTATDTTGIDETYYSGSISNFELLQNYPNPFNPTTEINFTLNHNSLAKLTVFNSSGEVVKTLNNSKLAKGRHSFDFDGNDLNSGLYFYQLEVEGVRSTKKMILMK